MNETAGTLGKSMGIICEDTVKKQREGSWMELGRNLHNKLNMHKTCKEQEKKPIRNREFSVNGKELKRN